LIGEKEMVSIHRNPYMIDLGKIEIPKPILERVTLRLNLELMFREIGIEDLEAQEK
jgi:hypothetical protein